MLIDYIRQIYAKETFKIKEDFEFVKFDDISHDEDDADSFDIWSSVKISYEGKVPESYKIFNLLIGDWVYENQERLTKVIHEKLAGYFTENYPDSDVSELMEGEDTSIWLDQLDYMPRTDEDKKEITFEIELILHAEAQE